MFEPWICSLIVLGLASCGINTLPTKDVWYTQHYIIMQDFERQAYRGLSDAGKIAFQDLFWKARNPDALGIFAARLESIRKNFWMENSRQPWNTDRARIYLLNGSPTSIDYDQNVDWALTVLPGQSADASTDRSNEDIGANRAEIWTYPYDKYLIKYVFVFVQPNRWTMVQSSLVNNQFLGEFESNSRTTVFGIKDPEKYKQEIAALEKKK